MTEYQSAIIKSIPDKMSKFASGLLTTAFIISPTTSIDPDVLIDHISKEADCLAAWHKHEGSSLGKGKQASSQDEAMAVTQGDRGKKRRKGKCHNCCKQGHWAHECWSPKKDSQSTTQAQTSGQSSQPGQPPAYQNPPKPENKPVSSANTVATSDDKWNRCWSVAFIRDELGSEVEVTPLECEEAGVDTAFSGGFAMAALTQVKEGRTA